MVEKVKEWNLPTNQIVKGSSSSSSSSTRHQYRDMTFVESCTDYSRNSCGTEGNNHRSSMRRLHGAKKAKTKSPTFPVIFILFFVLVSVFVCNIYLLEWRHQRFLTLSPASGGVHVLPIADYVQIKSGVVSTELIPSTFSTKRSSDTSDNSQSQQSVESVGGMITKGNEIISSSKDFDNHEADPKHSKVETTTKNRVPISKNVRSSSSNTTIIYSTSNSNAKQLFVPPLNLYYPINSVNNTKVRPSTERKVTTNTKQIEMDRFKKSFYNKYSNRSTNTLQLSSVMLSISYLIVTVKQEPSSDSNTTTSVLRQGTKQKDQRIFYYLHIHKSAGTTMCYAAKINGLHVNEKDNCNVQLDQRCCGNTDSLQAHETFAQQTKYEFVANEQDMYDVMDIKHYRYIVMLRPSQERYVSHYKHTLRENTNQMLNVTFHTWYSEQPDNFNVRKICGTRCINVPKYQLTFELFNYTLHRLFLFDDILFTNKYEESYTTFANKVGWTKMPIKPSSSSSSSLVSSTTLLKPQSNAKNEENSTSWLTNNITINNSSDGVDRNLNVLEKNEPNNDIHETTGSTFTLKHQNSTESSSHLKNNNHNWIDLMSALDDVLYKYAEAKYYNKVHNIHHDHEEISNEEGELTTKMNLYFVHGPEHRCTNVCCATKCSVY